MTLTYLRPLFRVIFAAFLLFGLGCAPQQAHVNLPQESSQPFSVSGEQAVPDRWWTEFDDPALDSLVTQALRDNFSLESAWQRLRQARSVVDGETAALWPTLDGFAEGTVTRSDHVESEEISLGLTSSYELDLWGNIRSQKDAARYRAEATFADYQTAALTLSAEVARTWYQLTESRHQLDLLEEQLQINEQVLSLIKARFEGGQVRGVDILRQKQLIEATREQVIAAESQTQTLEHQLAVLLGQSPQNTVAYDVHELPTVPATPETGLPAELVQRRPDVQRAFLLLQAADRDLATAVTNQYPRLSLSASASSSGEDVDALFDDWLRTVAGNLLMPLFRGGELRAEVQRSAAAKQERLNDYGQTVLVAFQEVEDALIREQKQGERIASLEQQVDIARQATEQLRTEYLNGMTNYIDVLTALTDEQQLERDLISAKRVLLEYRIALYRALASGFETDHLSQNDRPPEDRF